MSVPFSTIGGSLGSSANTSKRKCGFGGPMSGCLLSSTRSTWPALSITRQHLVGCGWGSRSLEDLLNFRFSTQRESFDF